MTFPADWEILAPPPGVTAPGRRRGTDRHEAGAVTEITIGVDVSKDTLDVHLHPAGDHRQFENTPKGLRAILKWIAGKPVARLVFEATGPYHRAFERAMGEAGLPLCKVNPRQAKRFGEAIGQLAKTDRMDAAMLARFGALVEPGVRAAPSKINSDLKDLNVARTALIKDRTAARNREKNLTSSLLKRHVRQLLSSIESHLKEIEAAIRSLINADDDLRRKFAILVSKGFSYQSGVATLCLSPHGQPLFGAGRTGQGRVFSRGAALQP